MSGIRVGIDVGGTFTDIVFLSADGTVHTRKVLSSPDDYSRAIRAAVEALLRGSDLPAAGVREVMHGTTVATNAIIEGKGARTGLLTTKGFRDVLEIRRMRTNRLYDITWDKPKPLVPRRWRREARERVDHRGDVLVPLDVGDVHEAVRRLVAEGVTSVAVCFLHAYANPEHERRVEAIIRDLAPHLSVSISSRVLPEIKEYERTSTTVINAYVRPVVDGYLGALASHLGDLGITAPLLMMQSNGGLMPAAAARATPIHIIESGPAAGVTGALEVSRRAGLGNLITLDIGGTTAKTSLIEDGQLTRASEYEVGGGISIGHRLLKGGGYLVRVPAVDIAEVGAGGGSIAWIDKGGSLQVGPQSAGACPGPACYSLGGEEPTLTDANMVLGYLDPVALAGGTLPLDGDRARQAVKDRIAAPLGLDLVDAAWAIHRLADASMVRALRAVSTERGRDPRNFALFAFGGKGPVHALGIAQALGIMRVIVPPAPGLFSSLALLFSEVEHHLVQTHVQKPGAVDLPALEDVLADLEQQGRATLAAEGYTGTQARLDRYADMRYAGQNSDLTISMAPGALTPSRFAELQEAFAVEHEKTYGYRSDGEPVQIVGLRLVARGSEIMGGPEMAPDHRTKGADAPLGLPRPQRSEPSRGVRGRTCETRDAPRWPDSFTGPEPRVPERLRIVAEPARDVRRSRQAYFGPDEGWRETPLVTRGELAGGPHAGPLIVEEYDATAVIPPGWAVSLDAWGNIVAVREAHAIGDPS